MLSTLRKGLRKILGHSVNIRQSWEQTPNQFTNLTEFLNWFDATDSIESTIRKAQEDWQLRFKKHPQFSKLEKGAAIEIGFGGGRLLTQSSKDFKKVYGIDIHKAFDKTREFLKLQNCSNFELFHRNEFICVPDRSIDLVYSFIVFQHFDSLDEVNYYLNHIQRVLKSTGYAHLYIGKSKEQGVKVVDPKDFDLRDCSLFINPQSMRELLEKNFEILDLVETHPRNAVTGEGESLQFSVVFKLKS